MKCFRQLEHIRGHLKHKYSVVVFQTKMSAFCLFNYINIYTTQTWHYLQ
jgi:hypothetical protein